RQVKIVDFGLAHQFSNQLTDPRSLLGSIEFMAPEQSHDPSNVGPAADVYGLAATFSWVLTGEAPYPFTANIGSALRSLQYERPRRLSELRPDVPAELDELFAAMLQREPSRRPTLSSVGSVLGSWAAKKEGDRATDHDIVIQLEQSLQASKADLRQAHDAMLFAMAKMAESQDGETPGHLRRLQRYVVALARAARCEKPRSGL